MDSSYEILKAMTAPLPTEDRALQSLVSDATNGDSGGYARAEERSLVRMVLGVRAHALRVTRGTYRHGYDSGPPTLADLKSAGIYKVLAEEQEEATLLLNTGAVPGYDSYVSYEIMCDVVDRLSSFLRNFPGIKTVPQLQEDLDRVSASAYAKAEEEEMCGGHPEGHQGSAGDFSWVFRIQEEIKAHPDNNNLW